MPRPIVLRFRVSGHRSHIRGFRYPDGRTRDTEMHTVTLNASGHPEIWPTGIPAGQIELQLLPPEIWSRLVLGQQYAITISPIEMESNPENVQPKG